MPDVNESKMWLFSDGNVKKMEDEYLIGDMIVRGTFSTVYRCLRKGRTEWSCKVMEKLRLNKDQVRAQVPKLMKLDHPNILTIKEVFETDSEIQFITECVTGGELFEKIVEKGQFSEQEAAEAVRDMLQALQYLHSQGIVHGDVTPENCLYETETDNSRVKMTEFGISQLFNDRNLILHNVTGATHYSAPEVLLGEEPSFAADLWSLGIVLYIMLSGYEPFLENGGEISKRKNIIKGEFSFSSPLWDDISGGAKEFISKLLSVDPKERPTAEEALKHPWTRGFSSPSTPTDKMIKGLREYNARRRFRVATKAVLATRRALNSLNSSNKCGSALDQFERESDSKAFSTGSHSEPEQCKDFSHWNSSAGQKRVTEQKLQSLATR